jgi:hypothetical protein
VDPLTVTFGAISAVALLAAVYFWLNPRLPKVSLAYVITQNRPLLANNALEDLRLTSHGVEVNEPWVVGVALVNDGKGPIRPGDFDGPVLFKFRHHDGFLQTLAVEGAALANVHPERGQLWVEGFAPQLLNPGDSLEFVALFDGPPVFERIEGRVAGVMEIRELKRGLLAFAEQSPILIQYMLRSSRRTLLGTVVTTITAMLLLVLILLGTE